MWSAVFVPAHTREFTDNPLTETDAGIATPRAADTPAASVGIRGLDEILGGGLPRNRLYLLDGEPGTGKTTLALQFLLAGRERGERGLYITLSETAEELRGAADSHGWSLDDIVVI